MMDHTQIRKLRDDLGVSQAALARATGINRTILSAFETGQLTLKGDCARRLSDFFADRGVRVSVQPPKPDPALVTELHWIEARIDEIECADCEKGFLDAFFEQEREERDELLVLLERWRVLGMALQGRVRADMPLPEKPESQAEYLALEYQKLRRNHEIGAG